MYEGFNCEDAQSARDVEQSYRVGGSRTILFFTNKDIARYHSRAGTDHKRDITYGANYKDMKSRTRMNQVVFAGF